MPKQPVPRVIDYARAQKCERLFVLIVPKKNKKSKSILASDILIFVHEVCLHHGRSWCFLITLRQWEAAHLVTPWDASIDPQATRKISLFTVHLVKMEVLHCIQYYITPIRMNITMFCSRVDAFWAVLFLISSFMFRRRRRGWTCSWLYCMYLNQADFLLSC